MMVVILFRLPAEINILSDYIARESDDSNAKAWEEAAYHGGLGEYRVGSPGVQLGPGVAVQRLRHYSLQCEQALARKSR